MPWLQATELKGFRTRSTSFWEVSTLPPTTAALIDGERIEFSGMINLIGIRHPELRGISFPSSDLRQYNTALLVMDLGALVFPITSGPVPVKSKVASLFSRSIVKVRQRGVPSSMYSVLWIAYEEGKPLDSENEHSIS